MDEDAEFLGAVAAAQAHGALSLEKLGAALGLSSPLLLRRLQRLVDGGLIDRVERRTSRGREVHYLPRPSLRVSWVSPHLGLALGWTCAGAFEWSLPLVAQISDAPSREALVAFIQRLRSRFAAREEVFREPPLSVIVFGSAARGDTRPDSDVDVLVVTDLDAEGVVDAAADASVVSARPLQVKVISLGELDTLPRGVAQGVDASGLVVFDGLGAPEVWRRAYGKRSGAGAARRGGP